ncbi:MAG: hypothetical protein AAGB04_09135 [Pseudomonadota bacterium]
MTENRSGGSRNLLVRAGNTEAQFQLGQAYARTSDVKIAELAAKYFFDGREE